MALKIQKFRNNEINFVFTKFPKKIFLVALTGHRDCSWPPERRVNCDHDEGCYYSYYKNEIPIYRFFRYFSSVFFRYLGYRLRILHFEIPRYSVSVSFIDPGARTTEKACVVTYLRSTLDCS